MNTLSLISTVGIVAVAFVLGIICVVLAIVLSKRTAARRDARSNQEGFKRMRDHERNQRWCF